MHPLQDKQVAYSEALDFVRRAGEGESETGPEFRVALLRNITVDPLAAYLKYFCLKEGLTPAVWQGEYDNAVQECLDPGSGLYAHRPGLIFINLYLPALAEGLILNQAASAGRTADQEQRIIDQVEAMISAIRSRSQAAILVYGFENQTQPALGLIDAQSATGQTRLIERLNRGLIDLAGRFPSVYPVDSRTILARLGETNYYDRRYWALARMPYTREAFKEMAWEAMKCVRALTGRTKKVLALDADDTLWGGVIGEVGLAGIALGRNHPGSAFRDFQLAILNLYHRGVVLALASKNNEPDVLEALNNHPHCLLKPDHFAAMRINWQDKASNLREMAEELNLGLDSFVFIDDSAFEIGLINQELPQVTAVQLDGDPTGYAAMLQGLGLFDALSFSEEDRRRPEMYREQAARRRAEGSFGTDLESYFRHLEMELIIARGDDYARPRISQLTQKTNQFNLTTNRYSETAIRDYQNSDSAEVLYLKLKDRFGDSGIVGAAIVREDEGDGLIDTFLLSCRIIGRCVEDAFLEACRRWSVSKNLDRLIGLYRPTAKNAMTADFYPKRGFGEADRAEDQVVYARSAREPLALPDYFKKIDWPKGLDEGSDD